MDRPLLVLAILAVLAVLGVGVPAAASDMTEAYQHLNVTFPVVPDPFYCLIVPRDDAALDLVAGAPNGSAVESAPVRLTGPVAASPFAGSPPDARTGAQVARALYLIHACLNAGDLPRLAAVWTDARFAQVVESPAVQADVWPALLAGAPSEPGRVQLLALPEVTMLSDGRVGYALDIEQADGTRLRQYGILAYEEGRYRLDQIVFETSLPEPALDPAPRAPVARLAEPWLAR